MQRARIGFWTVLLLLNLVAISSLITLHMVEPLSATESTQTPFYVNHAVTLMIFLVVPIIIVTGSLSIVCKVLFSHFTSKLKTKSPRRTN